jgi:hypothetical protein
MREIPNIKIGQKYQEVDSRFTRIIVVTGIDGDRVQIKCNGRYTWANKKRFNGRSRGYRLIP